MRPAADVESEWRRVHQKGVLQRTTPTCQNILPTHKKSHELRREHNGFVKILSYEHKINIMRLHCAAKRTSETRRTAQHVVACESPTRGSGSCNLSQEAKARPALGASYRRMSSVHSEGYRRASPPPSRGRPSSGLSGRLSKDGKWNEFIEQQLAPRRDSDAASSPRMLCVVPATWRGVGVWMEGRECGRHFQKSLV